MSTTSMLPNRRRRGAKVAGEVLLTVAAIGGTICILAVVVAMVFHVTFILFKTGSMTPTIPTGSLAVVQRIPASEIRVGDIVTVDRGTLLPITHRVTSVKKAPTDDVASRQITMKGDANTAPDPEPYVVSHVRRVMLSVPGLAYPLVAISNPLVIGGITVGAAALITWTFWPGGSAKPQETTAKRARREGGDKRTRVKGRRREGHLPARVPMIIPFLLVPVAVSIAIAHPTAAIADMTEQTITGKYLTLVSIADENEMAGLTPGSPATWQVGIKARPPEPGDVAIAVSAVGPEPVLDEFMLDITACTVRWVNDACPGTATKWLTDQSIDVVTASASVARPIASFPSSEQRWMLVRVTLANRITPGMSVSLMIHASGAESSVSTAGNESGNGQSASGLSGSGVTGSGVTGGSPRASLAFTGAGSPLTLLMIAGLLIVQGGILTTVMVLGSRRRSVKEDR
jgi:signal peptidase